MAPLWLKVPCTISSTRPRGHDVVDATALQVEEAVARVETLVQPGEEGADLRAVDRLEQRVVDGHGVEQPRRPAPRGAALRAHGRAGVEAEVQQPVGAAHQRQVGGCVCRRAVAQAAAARIGHARRRAGVRSEGMAVGLERSRRRVEERGGVGDDGVGGLAHDAAPSSGSGVMPRSRDSRTSISAW
jgi:hypothetical protein